jgi:RNA polymerase sigma factor (sigma-70 family)
MVTTIEFTDTEMRIATGVARRIVRTQRHLVEFEDVRQECFLWMVSNPDRVTRWRDEGKAGKSKLGTALYRAGMRYALKERVRSTGTQPGDHAFYSEAVLHELLSNVFDYENWGLESHEETEGKGTSRPSEGNTRLAMLVDVKWALEGLSQDDQNLLRDRFADGGMDVQVMAATMQVSDTTVRRRIKNTLRKLADRLGGEPPWM